MKLLIYSPSAMPREGRDVDRPRSDMRGDYVATLAVLLRDSMWPVSLYLTGDLDIYLTTTLTV